MIFPYIYAHIYICAAHVLFTYASIQGWNCSRVESLVWQYDISALMANQIEKQTGSKPLQVACSRAMSQGTYSPSTSLSTNLLALFRKP
jgi:hypothetical protein